MKVVIRSPFLEVLSHIQSRHQKEKALYPQHMCTRRVLKFQFPCPIHWLLDTPWTTHYSRPDLSMQQTEYNPYQDLQYCLSMGNNETTGWEGK